MMTHFRIPRAGLLACALAACAALLPAAGAKAQDMLGETRAFAFNFCPRGWAPAEGQLLPINQNQALYSLLGTNFGGDGRTSFGLPDYRGRSPIGVSYSGSPSYDIGQKGGAVTATMTAANMPAHNHAVNAVSAEGDRARPNSDFLSSGTELVYKSGTPDAVMDPSVISSTGGGQPFTIMPPYIAVTWCIALQGLFPSRN